jgi:hypothetical protein
MTAPRAIEMPEMMIETEALMTTLARVKAGHSARRRGNV